MPLGLRISHAVQGKTRWNLEAADVMIILNGMVRLSLLVGGWRHREQQYNLQGANACLSVIIPLAVMSLILPSYTVTTAGPALSSLQEWFLALMAVGLYVTFLALQTNRHRGYFTMGEEKPRHAVPHSGSRPLIAHVLLLFAYMGPLVYPAEHLAWPIDDLIEVVHAPAVRRLYDARLSRLNWLKSCGQARVKNVFQVVQVGAGISIFNRAN